MKKYIGILILIGLMSSCNDFLTEKPYDFLGTNFYQSEKDANIGLNGVFNPLQAQTYYQRTAWLVSELPGDNLQVQLANAPRQELEGFFYTDANAEIGNWWSNNYITINRANDLLEKVPAIAMDDAKKNNILGNARFLRALAYFELVRGFGDVPLVTSTVKGPRDDLRPKRTPFGDVYLQIIDDLNFAEANCFKENQIVAAEKGRVSSGAAATLLAKVYLTRASTTAAVTGDVQSALDACNRVIASNLYKLVPVYSDVFDPDPSKKNGPEHIFSVQFGEPAVGMGNIVIAMMFPLSGTPIGGVGAGSFKANTAFVNSYGAGDIRKAWNVSNIAGTATIPYFYFTKYRDANRATNGSNNSRCNWNLLRYADVLLMQSEAINILNSGDITKFNGINAVRLRAGLAPLTSATTPSSDSFVTALLNERAWELCMEGHRRYDLLRMGRLKQVQKTVYNRDIDDNHLLFPIPQTELLLNPNLKPNNPGF